MGLYATGGCALLFASIFSEGENLRVVYMPDEPLVSASVYEIPRYLPEPKRGDDQSLRDPIWIQPRELPILAPQRSRWWGTSPWNQPQKPGAHYSTAPQGGSGTQMVPRHQNMVGRQPRKGYPRMGWSPSGPLRIRSSYHGPFTRRHHNR